MIKLRRNHLILLAVILTVGYLAIPAGRQADSERTIVVDNGVGPDEDVVLSPIVKVTAKPTEVYIPRHTVGPDPERPRAVVGKPVMDPKNYDRQEDVMIAVRHAWKGYKDFAFGKDELLPVSKKGHDWFGISLMMLDNVDMLWHLGLVVEFSEVVEYIPVRRHFFLLFANCFEQDNLKFNSDTNSNLFEVTIRALGGLLAGYYWSGNELLKARATELGDLLMLAFEESKTPIPVASVNFAVRCLTALFLSHQCYRKRPACALSTMEAPAARPRLPRCSSSLPCSRISLAYVFFSFHCKDPYVSAAGPQLRRKGRRRLHAH